MNYGGQSITDRLQSVKYVITGSALGRAVCKATTEELRGPKRKHIEYLLQCTNQANVSIPQMVELLIERTHSTNWIVTFKALITIHHLMSYGNERFEACIASYSQKFQLGRFWDRSSLIGFEMSSHIRKYAAYLDEKREAYRVMGFDFCKAKRGKEEGMLRKMSIDKLFKVLPTLQSQLDALTNFNFSSLEMINTVISSAYYLMCKDIIRLYACYNDGMINVLEKFFEMNKKQTKEALAFYKVFLVQSENVSNFLRTAENCGVERSEIPDLTKDIEMDAPESLLQVLENHVEYLENNSTGNRQSNMRPANFDTQLNGFGSIKFNLEEQQQALDEEAKAMVNFNKLKESSVSGKVTSSDPPPPSADLLDLDFTQNFGDTMGSPAKPARNPFSSDPFSSTDLDLFRDVLEPSVAPSSNQKPQPVTSTPGVVFSSDIDQSLTNLMDNLGMNYASSSKKDMQWTTSLDQSNRKSAAMSAKMPEATPSYPSSASTNPFYPANFDLMSDFKNNVKSN